MELLKPIDESQQQSRVATAASSYFIIMSTIMSMVNSGELLLAANTLAGMTGISSS